MELNKFKEQMQERREHPGLRIPEYEFVDAVQVKLVEALVKARFCKRMMHHISPHRFYVETKAAH